MKSEHWPRGFSATGLSAGLSKKKDKKDMALFVTHVPANGAAVFTNNQAKAAPILLTQERLIKTRGKTTTDHISPAGAWLRYRGHLENFSRNMFTDATNAFSSAPGTGTNVITGEPQQAIAAIAFDYRAAWNIGLVSR